MRKGCTALAIAWLFAIGCTDRRAATETAPPHDLARGAAAPKSASAEIDELVRASLDAELLEQPIAATWLGVHAWDDRIDDVRPEAQARQAARLRALLERVRAIDGRHLDATRAFDQALLEHRADLELFELTELRPLERNPMIYCDLAQSAIFELIADDFLPPVDRLRAINARLWKIRPLFDDARRNLRPTASDLAIRRAAEEAQSAKGFLADTLPKAMQAVPDPKLLEELRAAIVDATRALDDFAAWLVRDLAPRARGEFALGRERLMELLRRGQGVDVTPELLVALGEREIKDARRRLDEATRVLGGGRAAGVDVGRLLEEDHGRPEELLTSAQQTLESAVAFIKAQRLLTPPEVERPKVVEMPPALWGYAQLSMPGPLEPHPHEAYLYVDPVDKSWPDKRKQEHLRTFNRPTMVRTILHDGVGHYVQAEIDRHAPTTMQKIAWSSLFVEGWAGYVEEMMLAEGWLAGDVKLRVAVARATLLRAARLVAAVKLHAFGAKIDDAAKVFTDEAGLDDYQARREAERAALDPMVLGDALGRIAILKLRDDWRAAHGGAALGAFHDALLRHGTPSPILLRRVLLPGDTASPL
ncbi:MAG: hypothetical protein JWN44_953 [Myxococcales bacterium]|nr:hypothetical protein [Myxococcales bacterium]